MCAWTKRALCLLALLPLAAAGCQRLDVEKSVPLEPGAVQTIGVDPPRSQLSAVRSCGCHTHAHPTQAVELRGVAVWPQGCRAAPPRLDSSV